MEPTRHKRLRPFEQQVLRTIRRRRLLDTGEPVLAAVSGGSDSVALLCALAALRPELAISVACGHVVHGLHDEGEAHARFAEGLADSMGIPFARETVDVRSRMAAEGLSLEHAAREERYAALEGLADGLGCTSIATGHTTDDQAETVLLNLLRGTGTRGLRGIPVRRGRVVRPLLDVTRAEARAYLDELGVAFVDDPTNESRDMLRNRVRHELLPVMDRVLGRSAAGTVARLADAASLEDEALSAAQEAFWREARSPQADESGAVVLSVPALVRLGRGAAALVLRRAARTVAGEGQDLSLAQVEQALQLLESNTAGGVQRGGGCEFRRDHASLLVQRTPAAGK
jgi:tRNA(Ile)-lysidine synthase